ncbi:MAG: glycosyltransferase [Candidatus Krumholzibacteriota bacterium]|nr:glycosyltransferase [Candidatus Krumholzibacteriota bacterium]
MDFVILANAWQDGLRNPTSKHHVAEELARQGHRVLWINGAGMRTPSVAAGQDRSRILVKLKQALSGIQAAAPSIHVIAPLIVPLPGRAAVRRLNAGVYALCARVAARRLGLVEPALINFLPMVPDFQRRWPWRKVYYCVDRWDAFDTYDTGLMLRLDEDCCRSADLVITTSLMLTERARSYGARVEEIPHGVNHPHFARALDAVERPADMPAGPVVGFIGLISEWVDQALLVRLARAHPAAAVVLIGKADVDTAVLAAEPNIHLLGPRPFARLPEYLAHCRVGIIPFVVNELTRAVNPIKLREMLAAGCPVVSTALPEVGRYTEGVDVAASDAEFVARVGERLQAPLADGERRALSGSVAGETWERKVERLLVLVTGAA